MSLTLKEHQTFILAPEGSHIARCYALIDLGMQYNKFYNNTLPKVMIGWELTNQLSDKRKPWVHFQRYTASLNARSALRALLEAWRGQPFTPEELEGFELKAFLGKTCYLTIQQRLNLETKQRWAKIITISSLPDVMVCSSPINPLIYFDLDNYTENDYFAVPEGIRKHINIPSFVEEPSNTKPQPQTSGYVSNDHPPDSEESQPDVDS